MTAIGTSYSPAAGGYATKERSTAMREVPLLNEGAGKQAPKTVVLEVPRDYTPQTFAASFMGMILNFTRGIDTPGMKMTLPADISVEELSNLAKNFENTMGSGQQPNTVPNAEINNSTHGSAHAGFDSTPDWQQHPIYLQIQELIDERRAAE